ncbi:type III-B CRISPR module RAMP protein Cmr6 [Ktedonospora formicarum]|uniref:CRISPR type III-associated protein domain-containing protein n=1 Tax=Ktedonospora formicarum TaxID=2778364 RepID=A0A8J3I537_9CHLR|nr:type III-B CRISPR module RAMP protein Cmr6 [Ktedonospora formicarum]GHO49664.1 hypothetical protein KSX_78270 [Ktedonospora formicarum]
MRQALKDDFQMGPLHRLDLKGTKGWGISDDTIRGMHAGLWLDKYIASHNTNDTGSRQNLVAQVASLPISTTYILFYQRWHDSLQTDYGNHILCCKASSKGRIAINLGSESVLETSIALHHTYGVPYLPGSALKGLAASYTRQHFEGDMWKHDGEAYRVIFGDTEQAGYITFFDALPIPQISENAFQVSSLLKRDIITVHHKEYYGDGSQSPADWDSPIPIPFLSTTGDYLVALAAPDLEKPEPWLNRTFEILKQALANAGIGAKTSSGYGRMELSEERL